ARLLAYDPEDTTGREPVLAHLAEAPPHLALFAFGRRPESAWLIEAAARAGVPWRIGLEYFDGWLDERALWPALTYEGWLFWGTLESPRLLLHALDPLLGPLGPLGDAQALAPDRVELYLASE